MPVYPWIYEHYPRKYEGHGSTKRPLIPGFPVTLMSRCFIGTQKNGYVNTLRLYLG